MLRYSLVILLLIDMYIDYSVQNVEQLGYLMLLRYQTMWMWNKWPTSSLPTPLEVCPQRADDFQIFPR